MNLKGQYITLEQLLIFTMGIFILTSIALVYNSAKDNTKKITVDDQFKEIGELVLSNIVYVYNSGKNSEVNAEVSVNIPVELSAQAYTINLSNSEILVKSFEDSNSNITIPIGTINESVSLTGNASSPKGRIKINYNLDANTIVLRDV